MDDEQYAAIADYLDKQGYSPVFAKSQKFVSQRSCKNFRLNQGKLYYKDSVAEGKVQDRLVLKIMKQKEFSWMSSDYWGHKFGDATIAEIKERYYWPNYYKEMEIPLFW